MSGGGVAGEWTEDWEAGGERGEVDVGRKTIGGGAGGGRGVIGVWGGVRGVVGVGGGHVEGHRCGWEGPSLEVGRRIGWSGEGPGGLEKPTGLWS